MRAAHCQAILLVANLPQATGKHKYVKGSCRVCSVITESCGPADPFLLPHYLDALTCWAWDGMGGSWETDKSAKQCPVIKERPINSCDALRWGLRKLPSRKNRRSLPSILGLYLFLSQHGESPDPDKTEHVI